MKNADKPINPVEKIVEFGDGRIEKSMYLGLTKREYFAAMAMQGLLSREAAIPNLSEMPYNVEMAVKAADELLNQLEK